jgi:predicted phosphodiesterase
MSILFIGDIHQQWDKVARGLDTLRDPPRSVVLLGDIECDRPLDALAAPLLDRGIAVHWIYGNHDNDGGPEMWANLCDPARNPRTSAGALHGRVLEVEGVRIAGLGGTFRPRVWDPPSRPRLTARTELDDDIAALGPEWGDTHRDALRHSLSSAAIWREDYDRLADERADILVTHEAPSSLRRGKGALDGLARAMGAGLIVHGHHHVGYRARAEDGLRVFGVGSAWAVDLEGGVRWTGDKSRHHAGADQGWVFEGVT